MAERSTVANIGKANKREVRSTFSYPSKPGVRYEFVKKPAGRTPQPDTEKREEMNSQPVAPTRGARRSKDGGEVAMEFIPGFTAGAVFRLKDKSMEPAHQKGDKMVCSRLESITQMWSGGCAVLRIDKHFMLKRVYVVDGHILLVSDREDYPVKKVEKEEIQEVWRVDQYLTVELLKNFVSKERLMELPDMKRDVDLVSRELQDLLKD